VSERLNARTSSRLRSVRTDSFWIFAGSPQNEAALSMSPKRNASLQPRMTSIALRSPGPWERTGTPAGSASGSLGMPGVVRA